jgi:hypothetical protein
VKEFFVEYFKTIAIVWGFSVIFGSYIKAINDKILYVKDVLFGLMFGPFWMMIQLADLNAVLWKAKEKSGAQ